jgi:drug/metabolite transporter (DMT)-like permease
MFFSILKSSGAGNVSLVTFIVPVSAILLGAVVLGERLEPQHVLGMAAIAAGLALIDGRLLRIVRRDPTFRRNTQ